MDLFFTSILIILGGGTCSLLLNRHFGIMKAIAVTAMGAGCLTGLIDAVSKLFRTEPFIVAFNYQNAFALAFRIDGLAAFFLVTIFFIALLSAVYSLHYLDKPEHSLGDAVHYFCFSLLVAAMALVVCADNMITFMLAWEIMSISSFFLVIHHYQKVENRRAGYLYFVFSHVGAMFILAAFGVIYGASGSLGFEKAAALSETTKLAVFILAFIGFGSKAGVFPFHVWLPHAHPAAPSHISAVMSGVMIKTGIYGILRMYAILNTQTPAFGEIVLIAGAISGVLGVVYALGQQDLKRLLAYSSVENIGIILIGIGIGMIGVSAGQPLMAVLGFAGGLLHVLNHSIFKSLLFMGAGMVLQKTGTSAIDALGGLLKKMKITGSMFLIGSLAVAGLPPFNGFVSEFFVYMGGFRGVKLSTSVFALSALAIISLAIIGGLALACFTKVLGVVFQGEPRIPAAAEAEENGWAMLIAMLVPAAACVAIGVFPELFIRMALKGVGALGLEYGRIPLEPFIQMTGNITQAAAVFLAVFLAVLALRMILYRGKPIGRAGTWGCGFTQPTAKMQYTGSSYAGSILEFFSPAAPLEEHHDPVKGLFPAVSRYQSRIHDIAERNLERVIVNPVMGLFDKLRWIQHGDIHLYIGYILAAIIALLFFI